MNRVGMWFFPLFLGFSTASCFDGPESGRFQIYDFSFSSCYFNDPCKVFNFLHIFDFSTNVEETAISTISLCYVSIFSFSFLQFLVVCGWSLIGTKRDRVKGQCYLQHIFKAYGLKTKRSIDFNRVFKPYFMKQKKINVWQNINLRVLNKRKRGQGWIDSILGKEINENMFNFFQIRTLGLIW